MTVKRYVDIKEPVKALCASIGLEPKDVVRLDVSPREVRATVLRRQRADGAAYVDPETGEVAVKQVIVSVVT